MACRSKVDVLQHRTREKVLQLRNSAERSLPQNLPYLPTTFMLRAAIVHCTVEADASISLPRPRRPTAWSLSIIERQQESRHSKRDLPTFNHRQEFTISALALRIEEGWSSAASVSAVSAQRVRNGRGYSGPSCILIGRPPQHSIGGSTFLTGVLRLLSWHASGRSIAFARGWCIS